jgi:phytoene dehydrogenase-like protein
METLYKNFNKTSSSLIFKLESLVKNLWELPKPRKVVVVGSGIGGIYTAAGMSKFGVKPIIYEKDGTIGGRAASYNVRGFWFDQCPHMSFKLGPPLKPSETKVYIRDAYGIERVPQVECKGMPMGIYYKEKLYPLAKILPVSPEYDRNFTKKVYPYLSDSDVLKIEDMLKDAMVELDQKCTPDVITTYAYPNPKGMPPKSFKNWIMEKTDRETILDYFTSIQKHYTQIQEYDRENLNMGVYLSFFATIMLTIGLMRFCYAYHPRYGGDAAEIMPAVEAIVGRGGEIHTSTLVKNVVIEKGKVKGVTIIEGDKEEFVKSDIVVVDVRPRIAVRMGLMPRQDLETYDPATIESIKDIEKELWWEGGSVIWNIGLSKTVTDQEGDISFVDEQGHNLGCHLTKPTSAPPNKQQLCCYRGYSLRELYPNNKINLKLVTKTRDDFIKCATETYGKAFEENIEQEETHYFPESYGIYYGWCPESIVGKWKTPIEGLYWAGDEVEGEERGSVGGLFGNVVKSVGIVQDITKQKVYQF